MSQDQEFYVKLVETIRDRHRQELETFAEHVRTRVVIPACKKHRMGFLSGNGDYFFWFRSARIGSPKTKVADAQLARDLGLTAIVDAFGVLDLDTGLNREVVGHLVDSVTSQDLKSH